MRGRTRASWWGVVLEARDALALAEFYSQLLEWPIVTREPAWAVISEPGSSTNLSFQADENYAPPVWPGESGKQQMMLHLDIEVDELDTAVTHALELGATLAEYQPQETVRVLLDPAGHPFCLYTDN